VLPVANLRGWIKRDAGLEQFLDWRKALDLLHETSLFMLQDLSSERFLSELLDRLFEFLEASRGAVLLRGKTGNLALLASRTKERASEAPLSLSPATVTAALERREALLLKEPKTQQPGSEADESITSTVMAVPMEHDGEVLGLFYFDASRARTPFTEDDLRFVASLGNLAAAKLLQLRLAEELRRKQDLERELRAAEAAAQAKSEFLAHMSHEIRTPMNAVLGFAHIALGEPQTPKAADCLRKIDQSGRSLVAIINDILDLSKIEAGRLELEVISFRLSGVLQHVTDLLSQIAEEKGLLLEAVQDPAISDALLGDPLRLEQVLINLLGNAIKFTNRGEIRLRVELLESAEGRQRLRFAVQDTGIGLAPDQIEKLFSAFTQADPSTTRRYGGTGLGLSISRHLVELMGGSIQVESLPEVGSTFSFTVWFPIASPAAVRETLAVPPWDEDAAQVRAGGQVLLVEDNVINQRMAEILLEDAGLQVDLARNGAEAIERVDSKIYDVVLMDVEMPDMDGYEATRRIRAQERHRDLPIIALTAHALASHRNLCLAAGMNDCLTKPIEPQYLFRVLKQWLRQAPRTQAPCPAPSRQDEFAALEPVMDVPLALRCLDGRRDLLKHFIQAFLDDAITPAFLRATMANGDREAAFHQAHSLKGIAGSLAIEGVADAASELEARLRDEPPQGWEMACDRLGEALERFRACVDLSHRA
jgi:signal transduction histidine kinase/CheY-like chemotaxis protein/HPt (histidine-containing phosphotransfer) domain-containing protein